MGDMSTRPTEPGFYWWKRNGDFPSIVVEYIPYEDQDDEGDKPGYVLRPGDATEYEPTIGEFGPRIPDPDEPRAEPTDAVVANSATTEIGLTAEEANHLYRLMVAHSLDTAVSSYRGHPDDPTLESVLFAELARIGFTRPTDAEIAAGVSGYYRAGQKVLSSLTLEQINGWEEKAKPIQVAAFRRAVAEARKPKGDDPC